MTLTIFSDAKDVFLHATTNPDTAKHLRRHLLRNTENLPLTVITIEGGHITNQERISPETL